MRAKLLAALLVLLVASAAAYDLAYGGSGTPVSPGGTNNPSIGDPVRIGFVTEVTTGAPNLEEGRVGITPVPDGYAARIGAELAVNATNAEGGVDGRRIQLIVEDSQSSPTVASQVAARLDDDGVLVLTGPTDVQDALAVSAYAGAHGVPFVSSGVSSALVSPPGSNWTVSVQPDAVEWGAAMAKYVSEAVPGAKVALMTQNSEEQREMAEGTRWFAGAYGNLSVVFDQTYTNSQFPWATAAAAAKFSGADAVILSWNSAPGLAQANVVDALEAAGFLQSQIFVTSLDDQVSDLGINSTGVRGISLFDGALSHGFPEVSEFVGDVHPYVFGNASIHLAYCGVCPKEIGAGYYYAYLGMEAIIGAIDGVLSRGQALNRSDFAAAMKGSSVVDAFGSTLRIGPQGSPPGAFYVAEVGPLAANGTVYSMEMVSTVRLAEGSVPAYSLASGG